MSTPPIIEVTEFTDPGCVWSWSFEAKNRWLRRHTKGHVRWRRVFGVAHDDMSVVREGFDPVGDAAYFQQAWSEVGNATGAPFAPHFSWIYRSTRPGATAAKAVERQGSDVADRVLRRLREAVFVFGRPGDTPDRIAEAVRGVVGLDVDQLLADSASQETQILLDEDFEEARRPLPEAFDLSEPKPYPGAAKIDAGRWRYAFPTLLIEGPTSTEVVPGWRELYEYVDAFGRAGLVVPARPLSRLSAEEALEEYGTLSAAELRLLTESNRPPEGAVSVSVGNGPFFVHHREAQARGLAKILEGVTIQ